MTDRAPPNPTAPARTAETLRRRARALAAPARSVDMERGRLLVFRRGSERFGVPLERVAATITATVTPIPGADAPVRAVVAWRGRPLAVYDLASSLDPIPSPVRLVVLGDWGRAVALLADELEDAFAIDTDAPRRAISASPLIQGITGDAVAVLDVDAVLSVFVEPR